MEPRDPNTSEISSFLKLKGESTNQNNEEINWSEVKSPWIDEVEDSDTTADHKQTIIASAPTPESVNNTDELWNLVVEKIKLQTTEHAFENWIKPINCKGVYDQRIELVVPNEFFRSWIQDCFLDLINQCVHEISGKLLLLDIAVDGTLDSTSEVSLDKATEALAVKSRAEYNSNKPFRPVSQESMKRLETKSGLNPKYVFDNFLVGASNQIAHAAAQRVAESPGVSYNPLFIYSQAGLGKTHLLHAIGNQILRNTPNKSIYYISAEKFVNELVESIRNKNTHSFRNKYRDNIDVLLIDDIQFIAGKDSTQEEFFHTFNYLYNSKKQIVFTSDKLPKDMENLEERLRTRFEWGLMSDIQPPQIETRIAILRYKAELDDIYLPEDVTLLIANHVKTNIRELEGCLVRLGAYASITNNEINLEMAKEVLKDVLQEDLVTELSLDSILKTVCAFYKVKITDVKGKSRLKEVTEPRQIAMYLARKLTQKSFKEIGNLFSGRDHSTVMHAVEKIERELEKDQKLHREVHEIESKL